MPIHLHTPYAFIAEDLKDLATELDNIALQTTEKITECEAILCQYHLSKVLKSLILATRISSPSWPSHSDYKEKFVLCHS